MFIYYNKKVYNKVAIVGSLKDLYEQAEIISKGIFSAEPEVIIKIMIWCIVKD